MTIAQTASARHRIHHLKLVFLTSGCASILALAAPALAQDTAPAPQGAGSAAPAEAGDGIVVTGFRGSLKSAMDAKRRDIRISDGISSEDIGKFPAENIAEAIQRIAGVQMSNINGRGATISIRGLGPQYAMTTINGQTFKSSDFTAGFRYDIIQTELANAIQVIKSPTADMDAGGLSGTVNIETTKPLSYRKREVILSVKGQNSSYASGKWTPKIGASYVDQFADDTLGVYLNVGYQHLKDRADYAWVDRWTTASYNGSTVNMPTRVRYRRIDRDTKRLMASGGLQWRPSDRLELAFSGIYAQDKSPVDINQQVFLLSGGTQTINAAANGAATSTTTTNFTMENNRQAEAHKNVSQGYTLSSKWSDDHGLTIRSTLNYTKGTSYDRENAAILGIKIGSATLDISNPEAVSFNVSNALTDPSNYNQSTLTRDTYPIGATTFVRSTEWSAQSDAKKELDLGPIRALDLGAKYRHETFNRYVSRHDITSLGSYPGANSTIYPSLASASYTVGNFMSGSSGFQSAWIAPDLTAYANALAAAGISVPDTYDPASSYHVDRYIPSAYLMADLGGTIAGMPWRGNIGMRYEHTHQRVDGNVTAPRTDSYTTLTRAVGSYTLTKDYGNALPSLSLILEPSRNVQIRFAAAKVLVRPILDTNTSMAQVTTTVANTSPAGTNTITVDMGQANLQPLTANQIDLGAEWYFAKGSGIAIDGFYKWVKNGTYSALTCPASYGGATLSRNSNSDCVDASGNIYDITQTLNDPSTVQIRGFEISWNQSLDLFLPVKGFGFQANYTRVMPKQAAIGTGYTVRNLSKDTVNLTGYWENNHFSLRASMNYRSAYQQNSADSFFAYAGHTVRARTQVDLSGGYTFDSHLSFTGGIINLNNSSEQAYYNNPQVWQESSRVGRSYYLSATYKF